MTTRCRSSSRVRGPNRPPPLRHPGHVRALAIGQTEFAWKLYKACRAQTSSNSQQGSGNLHFSPLIVHHALTMLYAGSRYGSAELLRTSLCLSSVENDAAVNLAYGDVTRSLAAVTNKCVAASSSTAAADEDVVPKSTLELHLATRLYVPLTHCGLLDQYVTSLRVHYGSDVAKVPFHTDRERACREINQWVEESTEQTVKDLVRTPHGLPTFVSIVLPSAVYFRAAWDKRFASAKAELAAFHNGSNAPPDRDIVQVMTFKVRGNFRHGLVESAGCRLAEVPFADERYSLVLILPVDDEGVIIEDAAATDGGAHDQEEGRRGLDYVEAKLNADVLVHLEEHLDKRSKIKLMLPRFRVDDAISLARVLSDDIVGIGAVFARGKVNLSGISGNNNLHLSHVEHKVRFEMDHVRRTKVPKKEKQQPEAAELEEQKTKKVEKKKKKEEPPPPPPPVVAPVSPEVETVTTATNGSPPPAVSANGDHAGDTVEETSSASPKKAARKATHKKPKPEPEVDHQNEDAKKAKEAKQLEDKAKQQKLKEQKLKEQKLKQQEKEKRKSSKRNIFEFNRPFIYVVRDRHLGMLLLMGCVRQLSPPPTPVIGAITTTSL